MQSRPRRLAPTLLFLALIAVSGAPAFENSAPSDAEIRSEAEALVDHADAMIEEDVPVLVERCCGEKTVLTAAEIRAFKGRKFYLLIPASRSPVDVRVGVAQKSDAFGYHSVQITRGANSDDSLWWTSVSTKALKRDDYFLSLNIGGFGSRAHGQLYGSSLFNWRQNNEYRLLAFRAPLDPSDPAFSIILEDQLLVTVTSVPNPKSFIPTVRPTVSIHPANLGFSMSGGRRTRYKISVGAGYALSALPFAAPETATQGFLRFQIRFK